MSDKSFGDHTSRNIVKNPLLSSAVTGLSLEDLTHKAVLLPVTPSVDQISTSDQQQGTQAVTLAHPKHDTAVFSFGDALANIPLTNAPQTTKLNVLDSKNNVKLEETRNTQTLTTSKASAKSDDDFDVNEYIARLQGTRYVSAPLHSHLKEDQNANLDATEENLEEINLNETLPAETQQSLTADIAQNFSQLPTVLPHVASAVFSSFSNMLSYKNREPTPDRTSAQAELKKSCYDDVQFQRPPDVGVSLMGVEEYRPPREVAPPPKEPPTGGASNFRITSKKKYAQIPGLSSGDATQSMTYMPGQSVPPMGQNLPPMGHNMPPMGHNMPPIGHNMPPMTQSMSPMSQNIPPMGQTIPSMGQNIPPMVQRLPPMSQSIPPSGGVSEMSQHGSSMSHSISNMSQIIPGNIPTMGQSVPSMGQSVPSMGQSQQPMAQIQPSSQIISIYQPSQTSQVQTNPNIPFAQNDSAQKVPAVTQNIPTIDQNAPSQGHTMSFVQTVQSDGQNITVFDPSKSQDAKSATNDDVKRNQANAQTVAQAQYNIFNPVATNPTEIQPVVASEMQPNLYANQSSNFFTPVESKEQNVAPAAIIPPPPMFSNIGRRDSQSSVGKSILPPSVARRISANQPIMKPATSTPSFAEKIFVPAPVSAETTQADSSFSSSSSAFEPNFVSTMTSNSSITSPTQVNVSSNVPLSSATPASYFTPSFEDKTASSQKTPTPVAAPSSTSINLPPSMPPSSFGLPSQPVLGPPQSSLPPIPPTSVITTGPADQTPQNMPPAMFQPPQNVPFFSPQDSIPNVPHPITQMPPTAIEPPKQIPEPPKASGAVNFRMTKKRPQYYAGPIEGVGAISNNVKPILAPVMPAPIEGALYTPDQPQPTAVPPVEYYAPNIDQASVPFDTSQSVEPVPTSFIQYDISQPQTYETFNITQPESSNYEHEYNTPFDMSRDSNDPYNEPKQESIGFGIIGSLKSKLSSIDINKIQNKVTTFFDPAFNDTKVADPAPQNIVPYQQQQYGQERQSNFDIFVPSVEHNQYSQYEPVGFDYSHGTQYDQTQDPYAQSRRPDVPSYPTSSYSTDQVYSSNPPHGPFPSNFEAPSCNPQVNIPQKKEKLNTDHSNTDNTTFYNPYAFTQENSAKTSVEQSKYETTGHMDYIGSSNAQISQQNVNYFDPNLQLHTTQFSMPTEPKGPENTPNVTSDTSNMTYYNPDALENRQIWEPQVTQSSENFASFTQSINDDKKNIETATNETYQSTPQFYNPNAFSTENQQIQARNSSDASESIVQDSSTQESDVTAIISEIRQDVQSDYDSTCDSALNTSKYNLSNIHTHSVEQKITPAASFFHTPVSTQDFNPFQSDKLMSSFIEREEPVFEHISTMPPIGSRSDLTKVGHSKKDESERVKETNLIESISKHEIPVVGVSTVPLFGLSTIIADTTKDKFDAETVNPLLESNLQYKSLFEEKNASSFFENVKPENKIICEAQAKTSPLGTSLNIDDVKNVLVIEPPQENIATLLKRNSSSKIENIPTERKSAEQFNLFDDRSSATYQESEFFKHSDSIALQEKDSAKTTGIEQDDNSELNICETCREVDTPDHDHMHEKNEDLTTQMIENITSRMSLSNPLTVPLADTGNPYSKISQYDQNLDEITQVAEETFETLQVQSATELLDEPVNRLSEIRDYGWVTQEVVEPKVSIINNDYASKLDSDANLVHDYGLTSSNVLPLNVGADYEFELDPNNIGFIVSDSLLADNKPLTKNASDEIKAEIKNSHEDIILPRQMSIPTAPPEEEIDSKSDEPGVLDVHSIEQDAKKDFPLDEEFIIEPSTDEFLSTDDDKLEFRERKKSSGDSSNDTFTNRIEKFTKKGDNNASVQSDQTPYISPPISMASYFDTGNFAVESHYRNTFVPMAPGFEEEVARKLREVSLIHHKTPEPYIPETSTQTKTSNTCTYMAANDGKENIIGVKIKHQEDMAVFAQAYAERQGLENIPTSKDGVGMKCVSVFNDKQPEIFSPFSDNKAKNEPEQAIVKPITEVIQPISAFIKTAVQPEERTSQIPPVQLFHDPTSLTSNVQSLPDPMNFFSANEEEIKPTEAAAESSNRLASYFSQPPPKPDHSKSFFELSLSQNHYRHDLKTETIQNKLETIKQGHVDDDTKNGIKELMKDLTSPQNLQANIVRTINYFTVELDQDVNKRTTNAAPINVKVIDENLGISKNINKPNLTETIKIKDTNPEQQKDNDGPKTEEDNIPNNDIEVLKSCKYCGRYINVPGVDSKSFVVKSAANSDTEPKNDTNMSKQDKSSDGKTNSASGTANYDVEKQADDNVLVVTEHRNESEYSPVKHHWFYRVDVEEKSVWRGFSTVDSNALEEAYHSPDLTENTLVATDGGRYDVNIIGRLRIAVYWKQKPTNVRRCSWFYKGTTDARYVPYTEAVAEKLEEEYRHGVTTGEWHRKLVLPNSELVIMHGPTVMVHFLHSGAADAFTTPPTLLGKRLYRSPLKIRVARDQKKTIDHLILLVHGAGEFKRKLQLDVGLAQATTRPRVVRRSHEESEIEESEPSRIDHLLLLCHGVGSACDMRFRSVEEVVEDFRTTSLQLLQSHYKNSYDNGIVNRVEVLPISWHEQLHSGETGVDKRLACVTLDSIPRLRAFTNHTVLDVLFYTSPVFHQTIIDTVCFELNRVYTMFRERNPHFKGEVSLGGHSLGSVILYDLLCHQLPQPSPDQPKPSSAKSYVSETAASAQLAPNYPQLTFPPAALYALGSPIAIFECIRGVQSLGREFSLPTCRNFFNIFHPYDPIAYRMEPLIDPQLQDVKPSQIPHHKGRKRMHLELKDTMARVGADLKQKLLESLRTTWNKWKAGSPSDAQLEKVVEEEMEKEQLCEENDAANEVQATPEMLGRLNCGRRVDYVLQEAPLEMINEYLFAMSSHVGYWESEDTMLLMLREIYSALGVQPDCTVPQLNMTVQRTKIVSQDESSVVNETSEIPSTSRGST